MPSTPQPWAPEWVFPTEVPLGHSPTVDNGTVYVGGLDRHLYEIQRIDRLAIVGFHCRSGISEQPYCSKQSCLTRFAGRKAVRDTRGRDAERRDDGMVIPGGRAHIVQPGVFERDALYRGQRCVCLCRERYNRVHMEIGEIANRGVPVVVAGSDE